MNSLDPVPGPRPKFAMAANGRWRVDGYPARLAAEVANDDEGNLVVTVIDPTTMKVVDVKKLEDE